MDLMQARLIDVVKIWDRAPHNALTDLIRFRNRWFCVFRGGIGSHIAGWEDTDHHCG